MAGCLLLSCVPCFCFKPLLRLGIELWVQCQYYDGSLSCELRHGFLESYNGAYFLVCIGITVLIDASAAKGICSRRGLGKLRHIEVSLLWVQEKVRDKTIDLQKVPGNYYVRWCLRARRACSVSLDARSMDFSWESRKGNLK